MSHSSLSKGDKYGAWEVNEMVLKVVALAACIICLMLNADSSFAQATVLNENRNVFTRQFKSVQIEEQSLASLFTELSLSYDIPVGFEAEQSDNDLKTYRINFKGGTLSELLTQFFAEHSQYEWEVREGAVNIFPKNNYRDRSLAKLLEVSIGNFSIKENTSSWALRNALFETSEVKKVLEEEGLVPEGFNFTGLYFPQLGRHFKLDTSRMTLKSILNQVIRRSPIARCWRIKKYANDGTFYLRVAARHEDSPASLVQTDQP